MLTNNPEVHADAAGALWSLAAGSEESQGIVAEEGAIEPLVQILSVKRKHAGASNAQIKACGALAAVADGSPVNQDAMTAAGGIAPLVALLDTCHSGVVQAHAATALAELTRDHQGNQRAVADAGAVVPLIEMLKSESEDKRDLSSKEAAAGALWKLSSQNFEIQTAVAKAGGITPLAALLGSGSSTAQKQAAGALGSLALDNEENEQAISTMIIELLTSSKHENAPLGSAEKAARAVSRLARAHPSNQVALARAGGIGVLIDMMDNGSNSRQWRKRELQRLQREAAEAGLEPPTQGIASSTKGTVWCSAAQKEVAGALWSLADKNHDNQTAIAETGGVPLLIGMLYVLFFHVCYICL